MSKLEYADDAARIDEDATTATARDTTIANGSLNDAAMVSFERKSKAMHIHQTTRVSAPATDAPSLSRRGKDSKSTYHDSATAA